MYLLKVNICNLGMQGYFKNNNERTYNMFCYDIMIQSGSCDLSLELCFAQVISFTHPAVNLQ